MNSETKVKQRPILFSGPMVNANLEDRKTVTRRIVKPQPVRDEVINGIRYLKPAGWSLMPEAEFITRFCKYSVGDILWVRETFWSGYQLDENDHIPENAPLIYSYRADGNFGRPFDMSDSRCSHLFGHDKRDWPKWKPSIFMPYDACRLFLQVTDIKVERLQDITEEQAIAEGIINRGAFGFTAFGIDQSETARDAFKYLWGTINGPDSWENNPFVFPISFKRINKPE